MAAGRNPTLMQQVVLMHLYPAVTGSSSSCEGTLGRYPAEEALCEKSHDKGNSRN